MRDHPSLRRQLGRGELVRLIYRLGRHGATGVLTVRAPGGIAPAGAGLAGFGAPPGAVRREARDEVFALRRGDAIAGAGTLPGEPARRALAARLARLAACDEVTVVFEGGVTAVIPPGAPHGVSLAAWARAHLEQQLDAGLAEALARELGGVRIRVRPELAPAPADEADRRMLAALAQPRRLDQIWPLARTPRFRLLAFLHFLRAVDALEGSAAAAAEAAAPDAGRAGPARGAGGGTGAGPTPTPPRAALDPRRQAALRTLGVAEGADPDDLKRAYRRLARALHPDLQPDADGERRRSLERRFAEVTAAYESLCGAPG